MHLKSLTLRGFKSFASATTLSFEPGITCVVGPNGSGKSNVVDALSWVMGEQGAKSLRGGKMEDVIFAGTAGRAPLGRAEVVLTIDNTDGALPIEYTEVTIRRTMFRNGGSEYAINGDPARLLDVQDLLSDSGIGREMHVIVGQGQLDSILSATPEGRRGFIEEAAGVLKHRKRKEKALRKLEGCQGNLDRLNDLLGELRRQLKPLGRQAEVARKAAVIQTEVRDARARLLADELLAATRELRSDADDEARLAARRAEVERLLGQARVTEAEAEAGLAASSGELNVAQETWYALAGLRERVQSTAQIAAERVRNATAAVGEDRPGRDPEVLEAEAAQVAEQEAALRAETDTAAAALTDAGERRSRAEEAFQAEEKRLAGLLRAAADRREGLARLHGQVNSLQSRTEAAADEIGRLTAAAAEAARRADEAQLAFTSLESRVAGLDAGEEGLDAEYESTAAALDEISTKVDDLRRREQDAQQRRAAAQARLEGLRVGLERKDATGALLAAGESVSGLLGSVAALISVQPGHEKAVAAALGAVADAVAVTGVDAALVALDRVRDEDLGRAGLLLSGAAGEDPGTWPELPSGALWAIDVIDCADDLRPGLQRILRKVAVVADLPAARALVESTPDVAAVTADGDLLSDWFASGGSGGGQSLVEVQAAVDAAEAQVVAAQHECDRLRFAAADLEQQRAAVAERHDVATARLHESDAQQAALAEELGDLNSTIRSARGEAERLRAAIGRAEDVRDRETAGLAELRDRLALAESEESVDDPDRGERDRLDEAARLARGVEMDARLGLRTLEERVRGLAGRAESLRAAARTEREATRRAEERRRRLEHEGRVAAAVADGAARLLAILGTSQQTADAERTRVTDQRRMLEERLAAARATTRTLAAELQQLIDTVHRDEMLRQQQQMRLDQLAERGLAELGLESEALLADYGPDQLVPVLLHADGTPVSADDEDRPDPVPYRREEQQRRLKAAERNLALLGKVNPLALEEFDALQERHAFLAEQLEDLRRTRQDLMDIVAEVDARVEAVFAQAYADVEAAFERVFARLFPGGEGRLVLTDPGEWLTTGVDVEARPPGKKVKRLSLLSGGERSLVAVAFLVSLFIARPSPFYILDEVEAALDDTNLGRLLEIYEELRESSQLLVITHQKRTMEIADALYGVTMRGDGVSTVISQRLRESEAG